MAKQAPIVPLLISPLSTVAHGGWCPKGRLAEDGCIDARYQLTETSTKNYPQRTEKNAMDADGTVIFTVSPKLTGGSKKTAALATAHGKPWIHICADHQHEVSLRLLDFIREHQIATLNVAGSRASKEPRVGAFTKRILEEVLVPNSLS